MDTQPLQPELDHGGVNPAVQSQDAQDTAHAVKDATPILEDVSVEYGDSQVPAGVDAVSLPPFKDMSRVLPADRVRSQMQLAKFATSLPSSLLEGDGQLDIKQLTAEDLDAVANMLVQIQELVLDNAQDRAAMENWLLDQDDSLAGVMYAFGRYRVQVGN